MKRRSGQKPSSDERPKDPQGNDFEGMLITNYNPMSPPNWGLFPFNITVFVYRDVREAMRVMERSIDTLRSERVGQQRQWLSGESIYFRGHTEVAYRFLPTMFRTNDPIPPRQRYSLGDGHQWYEELPGMRSVEDTCAQLGDEILANRYLLENAALNRAAADTRLQKLDEFQRRAAVRHYAGVKSPLMDVSTSIKVAAFFATGSGEKIRSGELGMLWALDLNFLNRFLSATVEPKSDGFRVALSDQRKDWGVNEQMLEEYGIPPSRFVFTARSLPLPRPTNQHGRFLAFETIDGVPMTTKAEVTWWSMFERWAYPVAFIQDAVPYEDPQSGITTDLLLPKTDPFLAIGMH